MKKSYYTNPIKIMILPLMLFVLTVSCESSDGMGENETSETFQEEIDRLVEIQEMEESIDNMIESLAFDADQVDLLKNNNTKLYISPHQIPECAMVSASISDSSLDVIIDFGDGCTTEFDHELSGKIIVNISRSLGENKSVIEQSFENFTFDGIAIEGTVSRERVMKLIDSPSYAIIQKDLSFTWEDDSTMSIESERQREWIEGNDNMIWSDNVYSITGNSKITKKDGSIKTIVITEPLRREVFCKNIVSGELMITYNENTSYLNYGEGECDNLATLTINGNESIIELKRIKR